MLRYCVLSTRWVSQKILTVLGANTHLTSVHMTIKIAYMLPPFFTCLDLRWCTSRIHPLHRNTNLMCDHVLALHYFWYRFIWISRSAKYFPFFTCSDLRWCIPTHQSFTPARSNTCYPPGVSNRTYPASPYHKSWFLKLPIIPELIC